MGKEVKSMNNVKVRTKLIIVMLAAFLAMTACVVFSTESMKAMQTKALETIESDKRASYDEMIQNQVDNVISLCQNIYTQYEAGVYTREEAKKLAADEIRQLRYGDGGYVWVDQYDGTNVVLLGSQTEGTNRLETKDGNGYQMVKEIIRVGKQTMFIRRRVKPIISLNVLTAKHLHHLNGLSEQEIIRIILMKK